MQYIHITTFCAAEEIVNIVPIVRASEENGYKFLTLIRNINGENKSENIYMSKATAEQFELGQVLTKQQIMNFSVVHTTNAKGEPRTKLTVGASTWIAVKDLF